MLTPLLSIDQRGFSPNCRAHWINRACVVLCMIVDSVQDGQSPLNVQQCQVLTEE